MQNGGHPEHRWIPRILVLSSIQVELSQIIVLDFHLMTSFTTRHDIPSYMWQMEAFMSSDGAITLPRVHGSPHSF